jgi:hypothetical protein
MKTLIEVPATYELEQVPETGILGVLEHTLLVAAASLAIEHPSVGQLDICYEGREPPRGVLLAQLVVDRCAELSDLIGWYRRSCCRGFPDRDVEDPEEQTLF